MNPTPPRRESSEDRRLAIAEAARDLIVEKGVEGLRTRDIADRVGINIATLHYHVPTKEALIHLVAQSLRDFFITQSQKPIRRELPPLRRLELEFDDFVELLGEKRALMTAMTELMERARRDETVRAAVRPMMAGWRSSVAEVLEAGLATGDFRPDLDPAPAAQMLVSAMLGFSKSPEPTPENFTRLRAELLRAVRNPFPSAPPKDHSA